VIAALLLFAAQAGGGVSPTENGANELGGSAQAEIDFCNGPNSDQPYLFCLSDRRYERGERELKALLPKVRAAALAQRSDIAEFNAKQGRVTLEGDPLRAFESSQRLWEKSFVADCRASGLSQATGNAGTQGVSTELECEADRIFERIDFLKRTYGVGDAA
jgi:hypothetical protein